MSSLKKLSNEQITVLREKRSLPYSLYNQSGQILIHKTDNLSNIQIDRILRFVNQGIYCQRDPKFELGHKQKLNHGAEDTFTRRSLVQAPSVLSNTKLLSKHHATVMSSAASELIAEMHNTPLTPTLSKKTGKVLEQVFTDFRANPDFMVGTLNILNVIDKKSDSYLVDLMVKRAIIAMAIKTRGMLAFSSKEKKNFSKQIQDVMLSSFLCDISYARMSIPSREYLTEQEFAYIQNHPVISYMMIAHEPSLSDQVKQSILLHHHPLNDISTTRQVNGYPTLPSLLQKLNSLQEKYNSVPERKAFCADIQKQIQLLQSHTIRNEDANILAIASAFASLSSDVPWRQALTHQKAVRQIINQSLFNYSAKIMQEFLDFVAVSLCDNQQIIQDGSYVIIAVYDNSGSIAQYELAQVLSISYLQSKPSLVRLGLVEPKVDNKPHLHFQNTGIDTLKPDHRRAHYDLSQDFSRRVIYLLDPEENADEYALLSKGIGT